MPECMRMDVLFYSGFCGKIFYYCENHSPGKPSAPSIKKKNVLICDHRKMVSVLFININLLQRFLTDRNKSLFIAFACNNNKLLIIMDVSKTQVHKFRNPQSTSVKCFNYSFIPVTFRSAQIYFINYSVNLFHRKYFRKFKSNFW